MLVLVWSLTHSNEPFAQTNVIVHPATPLIAGVSFGGAVAYLNLAAQLLGLLSSFFGSLVFQFLCFFVLSGRLGSVRVFHSVAFGRSVQCRTSAWKNGSGRTGLCVHFTVFLFIYFISRPSAWICLRLIRTVAHLCLATLCRKYTKWIA